METSVAEIHGYPLQPEGFEEPLFPTPQSRRVIAEHLLRAPWLSRASELEGGGGQAVHIRRQTVKIENYPGGVGISWASGERGRREKRRVVEVLDSWREIRAWWDKNVGVNRVVVRVLLSDGAVLDLARESSGWFCIGVED